MSQFSTGIFKIHQVHGFHPVDSHSTCVICCEVLTSDGKHEIVVLANCGHIFGRSCIDEWIATGKKECPNCKKKATKKVRVAK